MKKYLFWVFSVQIIVIAFGLILGYQRDNLDKHFGEAGFITTFSFFNLLFTSYILAIVFHNTLLSSKEKNFSIKKIFSYSSIWLAMSIGFLWLSFDEMLMIHERTGKAFHEFFQIKETPFTSRIDDLIVFSYPILGFLTLYFSRKELYSYRKALYFAAIGVMLFCVMAIYDSMGKGLGSRYHDMRTMFQVYEESSKVLAEGFFVVAALYCLRMSERLRHKNKKKVRIEQTEERLTP